MPGRVTEISEQQDVYDLQKELARLRRALAAAQLPTWTHDIFTAPATYQLTYIPYGINALADNGTVLSEGTDYTVDYTTGLIAFTVGRTSGHVIFVSYVTTGDLTALSGPVDSGVVLADNFNRANSTTTINPASDGGSWTIDSGTWGITSNKGVWVALSGGTRWGNGPQDTITRNLGTNAADVSVKFTSSNGVYNFIQIFVAIDKTANTGYYLRLSHGSNNAQFLRANPGAAGTIGSSATITEDTAQHTVRVTHDGAATLKFYYDGVLTLTATDTSLFSTGTWVGISADNTVTWDDFSAS